MKTSRYNILLVLWALMLLVACSDSSSDESEKPVAPSITLDTEIPPVIVAEGGTVAVGFKASADWTATSDQPWCIVSPASGKAGNATVTVSAEKNEDYNERNATLILRVGTVQKKITVTQKQNDALTVTADKIEVATKGGEITVEVKANVRFEYEVEEEAAGWIVSARTGAPRALTTSEVKFDISPNEEGKNRQGRIVFSSGALKSTVTVYQEGGSLLLLSKEEYTVSSGGGEIVIELRSNVDYEMVLPDVDWLTEVKTKALSSYSRRITVLPNEGYDARTAEIYFVNELQGIREKVNIVQVQKDAVLVAREEYDMPQKGGVLGFELNTNVETFDVECSETWIRKALKGRGLTAYPLSFVVEANPEEASRSAIITIIGGQAKQQVEVVQAGLSSLKRITIVHSNRMFSIPRFRGSDLTGLIKWGDGKSEEYADGISHTYTTDPPYTVVVGMNGAEEVTLHDLSGVEEVDFSKF